MRDFSGNEIVRKVKASSPETEVIVMLAGATGIDFVLLVIAADDSVMPQTREHLAIVDLLGIERGLVALTKIDLVSSSRRAEVADEIRQEMAATGLAGADILAASTVTGEGIDDLRRKITDAAQAVQARNGRGRFRLAVDRCFTLAGTGTVVTGTVLSGSVAVEDQVIVSPSGLKARVRSIHVRRARWPGASLFGHGAVGARTFAAGCLPA